MPCSELPWLRRRCRTDTHCEAGDMRVLTQRDQIAAEFVAMEKSFKKMVGLTMHDKQQASSHSSLTPTPSREHSTSEAIDLSSGVGLPVWDEDRIRCIERTSNQNYSALREVRAERDQWRDRATRAERELQSTKQTLRELRAHCGYLETQVHSESQPSVASRPASSKPCPGRVLLLQFVHIVSCRSGAVWWLGWIVLGAN